MQKAGIVFAIFLLIGALFPVGFSFAQEEIMTNQTESVGMTDQAEVAVANQTEPSPTPVVFTPLEGHVYGMGGHTVIYHNGRYYEQMTGEVSTYYYINTGSQYPFEATTEPTPPIERQLYTLDDLFLVFPELAPETTTEESDTTTTNLGEQVSSFVQDAASLFKMQKEETIAAIKECREKIMNSTPENRAQIRQECKAKLQEIKDSYKESRMAFKELFKEKREEMRMMMKDAKAKLREMGTQMQEDMTAMKAKMQEERKAMVEKMKEQRDAIKETLKQERETMKEKMEEDREAIEKKKQSGEYP